MNHTYFILIICYLVVGCFISYSAYLLKEELEEELGDLGTPAMLIVSVFWPVIIILMNKQK